MLLRLLHIAASAWLVLLLLFGTTPQEFVHGFTTHHDTVHCPDVDGPVMDSEHHHCSFLGFELMPFAHDLQLPVCPQLLGASFLPVFIPVSESAVQQIVSNRSLRGPPAA